MKCTSATILGLLIATICLAQDKPHMNSSQVGIELSSLIRRTHIKVLTSHQICMNWSITGEAAIAMHKFSNRRNEEEEKHKEEFEDENKYSNNNASNHTALLFTYWPQKVYDGFFISTGGKIHLNGIADCTLKIGYCMKIYKWITLSAGYGADLIGSYQSDRLIGDGIEICINIRI